jgi:hypothetical protein
MGDEEYAQARLSATKRANGLAKPSNGLASRSAGLGLGSTLKSKPKPEKARFASRKVNSQEDDYFWVCSVECARRCCPSGRRKSVAMCVVGGTGDAVGRGAESRLGVQGSRRRGAGSIGVGIGVSVLGEADAEHMEEDASI